ncbi:hypothetical protein [Microbispora sp. ATCC PTA-5024]|uniref:hypothetical protein n=1 Tax=Microbispora sp. ATCC PTA-5024 TaxID=316330 RepID=UPI00041508F4|nr:hypothetical protein [Microbispora sp. ATCC PTA-5024]
MKRDESGADVARSPYERVVLMFGILAAALHALFVWSVLDWFPWPPSAVLAVAVAIPVAGSLTGLRQARRFRHGYGRFGAALGFLLANLLGLAVAVLAIGLVIFFTAD